MDFSRIKNVYMIGVKGVGMTMLAQFMKEKGFNVVGSDIEQKFMTDEILKKSGVKIYEGFSKDNIPDNVDLIVYSSSYNVDNNVELMKVAKEGRKVLTYAEALGKFFDQYNGIAVVGSHGKTTTSAWLGYVMDRSGKSPNVMVGAKVPQFDGASLIGKSDYMIIEADEYQNKLKYFNPKYVLLNNIDYDHPDYFPDEASYLSVFIEFIKKIPRKGFLVANYDDEKVRKISVVNTRARVVSYAINNNADYVAYNIKQFNGKQYFKVKLGVDEMCEDGECIEAGLGDFVINLSGKHNISNALAVIATCVELGVDLMSIRKHLEDFSGTARRMEILGKYRGALIIDDYAHHPTEIKTTLAGVRDVYPDEKLRVVFHPHTFTRTKFLIDEFAESFEGVDELIVLDIYGSVRESQGGVSSEDLVKKIKNSSFEGEIKYIPKLEECERYLRGSISRGELVLLMGAGDVFRIGERLMKEM